MEQKARKLLFRIRGEDLDFLKQQLRTLGFQIDPAEEGFGKTTRDAVLQFQTRHQLDPTGIVDEATARLINDLQPPSDRFEAAQNSIIHVQVQHSDGTPYAGAFVQALDKDLRSMQELGHKTETDRFGRCILTYTSENFARAEKASADLVFRVESVQGLPIEKFQLFRKQNGRMVPHDSAGVIFNAAADETVEIKLSDEETRASSKFERDLAAILPLAQGVPIAELTEDEKLQDVTFLSAETSIEPEHIAFLILAHRHAATTQIPPEAFYAFLFQNLPSRLPELFIQPHASLRQALQNAITRKIISEKFTNQIEVILEQMKQAAIEYALQQREVDRKYSFTELLRTALPSSQLIHKFFLHSVTNQEKTSEEFWTALRADPDFKEPGVVERVQLVLQLGIVTGNHVPLVEHFQRDKSLNGIRDLATFDAAALLKLMNENGKDGKIGFPPDVPGKDDEEKAANYTHAMERMIQDAFPTEVLSHRLRADDQSAFATEEKDDLVRFFSGNLEFDLRTTNIDQFLKTGAVLDGIADQQRLSSHLKTLQRIVKVTNRYSDINTLLKNGFRSSQSIARMSQDSFISNYSDQLGGRRRAKEIYSKAHRNAAFALTLYGKYADVFYSSKTTPYSPSAVVSGAVQAGVEEAMLQQFHEAIPNWTTLFGSPGLCECEHCRSVYSPTSYLVDVLQFLKNSPPALAKLFERRPDIQEIELSCENTNTMLPYVDLVNELLENAISPVSTVPQTTGTEEELKANPDHINVSTYQVLQSQKYPFDLPFHLWIEEARTYLNHLGVARHELMETFQPDLDSPGLIASDVELLGLTSMEVNIVTGSTQDPTWNLWGLEQNANVIADPADSNKTITGSWIPILRRVDVFLLRAGLSYQQLLDLLTLKYVNPNQSMHIDTHPSVGEENKDTCDLSKLIIVGLDEPALGRVHRFIRLWQELGWTVEELDKAITAFKQEDLNPFFLKQLANIVRLRSQFKKLPVERILSWWALIDTTTYSDDKKSLYNKLFLNKAILNPTDPIFELNASKTDLNIIEDITQHTPALLAALGITETDLVALLESELTDSIGVLHPELNLVHLSHLYRIVSLSKALKLSIPDFLVLKDLLTGVHPYVNSENQFQIVDPFDNTSNTSRFVQKVWNVQSSRLTIPQLNYLLRHRFETSSGIAPTEESIALVLNEIRTGLAKIRTENSLSPDPNGEVTSKKLSLLKWGKEHIEEVLATMNGTAIYEAMLDASPIGVIIPADVKNTIFEAALEQLPAGLEIPSDLENKISYDASAKLLRFTGEMSTPQRTSLLNASNDPSYQAAVNTLYELSKTFTRISYDDVNEQLRFAGAMTIPQRNLLASLPNATVNYSAAIETLFVLPRKFVTERMKAFEWPPFSAPLQQLEPSLEFPEELQTKIYYDPAAHQVHFNGVMTESERNLLSNLSTNSEYQDAISALFSAPANFSPEKNNQFLNQSDAAILFDSSLTSDLQPVDPAFRFQYLLKKLLDYIRLSISEALIKQKLSESLKLETESIDKLLTEWVHSPADLEPDPSLKRKAIADYLHPDFSESNLKIQLTSTIFPAQFRTFLLLQKIAMLAAKLKLNSNELAWIFKYGLETGWLDFNQLPTAPEDPTPSMEAFMRLLDLLRLRSRLPRGAELLSEIFALARQNTTSKQLLLDTLSERTGWALADLEILAGNKNDSNDTGHFHFNFPDSYKDERALLRLKSCFALLKRLGVAASEALKWVEPDVNAEISASIKQTAKSKYDLDQWLTIAKPLRDALREKQRAALVSHVLNHPNLAGKKFFRDSGEIYEHFLIDVEMDPCMMTSRIKQAISSVQLFVQRCLMNFEESVSISPQNAEQWKWMKNYRVWEANRKIFLYPENWIQTELRDIKSQFFKDLMNQLLQNDVTKETAETVFMNYLEKLDEVARLKIVAAYQQLEYDEAIYAIYLLSKYKISKPAPKVDVIHVFGRTDGQPATYYYRKLIDSSYWTPWERVDLDIESDHLIPVIWNRRLYLFWAVFNEKSKEEPDVEGQAPTRYWEIRLFWSEYKNGKWGPRKQAEQFYEPLEDYDKYLTGTNSKEKYTFRAFIDSHGNLVIRSWTWWAGEQWQPLMQFVFSGCNQGPVMQKLYHAEGQGFSPDVDPLYPAVTDGIDQVGMTYQEDPASTNDQLILPVEEKEVPTLNQTPGRFELVTQQDLRLTSQRPFFFQDQKRTFFVIPQAKLKNPLIYVGASVDSNWLNDYLTIDQDLDPSGPVIQETDPSIFQDSFAMEKVSQQSKITEKSGKVSGAFPSNIKELLKTDIGTHIDVSAYLSSPVYTHFLFQTYYHPYVCELIRQLNRDGIDGLLQRTNQTTLADKNFFVTEYEPDQVNAPAVVKPYPVDDVDFSPGSAYSLYNWELFFHAPLLIAERLSINQKFEDAMKWFHYIFDPTDRSKNSVPQRFWKVRPFFENADAKKTIAFLLKLLALSVEDPSLQSDPDVKDLMKQIDVWRKNPFKPHRIAEMRITAYQKTVVMKYLDNLIAWADQLFRRDTLESINEATQLYILAAQILGRRPEKVPPRGKTPVHTYKELESHLDDFSNALAEMEKFAPDDGTDIPLAEPNAPQLPQFYTLYFCIPKNDKLIDYWNTVADRLFKIRHCMNIEGVVRQLPLFEPPIDPGLLVKAFAMGVDISSVLNDINAPLPHYRFRVMSQKATELCNDVKSLGAALLGALEKRDAEELALLRSTHEMKLLEAVRLVREKQIDDAKENLAALQKAKTITEAKRDYYRDIVFMNEWELAHLVLTGVSAILQATGGAFDLAAASAAPIPDAYTGGAGSMGSPLAFAQVAGGSKTAASLQSWSRFTNILASLTGTAASMSSTLGSYWRRWDEFKLQEKLANRELQQIDKQIAAAEVRLAITEQELTNHDRQVENAREVDEYMKTKFTNRELYDWMVSQISAIYFQSYQLAYDVAKRAERAFRFELGLNDSSFVQFGYWDSLKKGLLAGEKLHYDLKRMEAAHLDQNKREYEITKHISLAMVDPLALILLKETGQCFIHLLEVLFDMDFPGHYMRRVKSLSLTIPCVTGPYTGLYCTMTLLKNQIRMKNVPADPYVQAEDGNDDRFVTNFAPIQTFTTSSSQNDAGVFELNLNDDRYLPCEGAGAISTWRIELTKDRELRTFDYNTISDIILHLRYTAREGGEVLKTAATEAVKSVLFNSDVSMMRAFSVKHEFPEKWHKFLHPKSADDVQTLELPLTNDRFPFYLHSKQLQVTRLELFFLMADSRNYAEDDSVYTTGNPLKLSISSPSPPPVEKELMRNPIFGGLPHAVINFPQAKDLAGIWKLELKGADVELMAVELRKEIVDGHWILNKEAVKDLLLVYHYSASE